MATAAESTYSMDDWDLKDPITSESVQELRQRLRAMKQIVAEQENHMESTGNHSLLGKPCRGNRTESPVDNGNFLSIVFGGMLVVVLGVSFYAFQNLYNAIMKRVYPTTPP